MNYYALLPLLTLAFAQRPGFLAGSPGSPELAYRFRTGESSTETPVPAFGNRLGGETGTTRRIPVDARGDADLVNRVNSWPRENKPFWLLNYEIIEARRNEGQGNFGNQQVEVQQRFGSPDSNRNDVRDQRGFNPAYDYDDFGNRMN
ncbi:uncharacterized protein LOC116170212 [Photinus pyralis]|uniref:Uncharacterized protein n=1 Tax=Photinus pyralis TaxID=7054 RepID=A0A1Y1K9S2_PHOPY|nr:uncharacterized protein LOC116170212 [Photinus pyralis]